MDDAVREPLADGEPPPTPDDVFFPATLSILTTSLPYAGPGVLYDTTLEATGGTGTYGWSVSPPLPGWATLDPVSGRISGTPDATDVDTTTHTFWVIDDAVPHQTDTQSLDLVVQPSVVNNYLSLQARPFGLEFAPDPSSQAACTIGGNVAENAGGPHTLKYGVTSNHILGQTVVFPDGEVANYGGPFPVRTGPDFSTFLIGTEGTIAISTEIIVRLPPPKTRSPD